MPSELLELLPGHVREPDPSIYLSDNYVVVDFETTTRDFGTPHDPLNTILLASFLCGPGHEYPGLYREVGSAFEMDALVDAIERADFFVAHHAKFELGWLERCGMDLSLLLPFCTKIAEKCIAGNRPWPLSLSDCLKRRHLKGKDPIGRLIRLGVDTLSIPLRWLGPYCDQDVISTEALFLDQREQLQRDGILEVAFTRNILTPALFDIEKRGLHLNVGRVHLVYGYYKNELARLEAKWSELTSGVNPNSGPQKRVLLYEDLGIPAPKDDMGRPLLTDTGLVSASADALKRLKLRNKKQKDVVACLLELTSVSSALSKYVRQLHECANNEGIVYGEFVQTTAATHRLSSKGRIRTLQLQNFQKLFRPCVDARQPGWFIGDGDAAGIEFRAAIDLAKDDQGLTDIKGKVDIHANSARVLCAADWDESLAPKAGGNKKLRQDSKKHTFKPLYGGQTGTRAQRDYFKFFRERYHATHTMQRGWTETVLKEKQLRTASGLIFYWPDCKLSGDGKYIKRTTQIFDYPVQSFATADMSPTATLYLWHLMRVAGMQSFLIDLVHDSAVGEIHPDEREDWSSLLKYCFNELIVWYLKEVYDYTWVTPLESEVTIQPYWNDADQEFWNGGDDWTTQWRLNR